jgi:hypothetical protein
MRSPRAARLESCQFYSGHKAELDWSDKIGMDDINARITLQAFDIQYSLAGLTGMASAPICFKKATGNPNSKH